MKAIWNGAILWREVPIATLMAGEAPLVPRLRLLPADLLEAAPREAVKRHLAGWLERHRAQLPRLAGPLHAGAVQA